MFSGDGQRDETLKSADWFAVDRFATAIFRADRFRKTGADRYVARGTLKMKDVTVPISLPFTLRITGDRATMQGIATVDRTAYKIGQGDYAATDEIPAAVKVAVTLNATRPMPACVGPITSAGAVSRWPSTRSNTCRKLAITPRTALTTTV